MSGDTLSRHFTDKIDTWILSARPCANQENDKDCQPIAQMDIHGSALLNPLCR